MCFFSTDASSADDYANAGRSSSSGSSRAVTIDSQFQDHYATLKRIAQSRIHRDGGGAAIDSASIVNECYLKLREANVQLSGDRVAFLAYASQTMRSVIVDSARHERTQRRGGDFQTVSIDSIETSEHPFATPDRDIALAYDIGKAIERLAGTQPRLAQMIASLYQRESTISELAHAFSLNERTIRRDRKAASTALAEMLG
jgi:RNA polymerase sigma factor (TIGR02999 family)